MKQVVEILGRRIEIELPPTGNSGKALLDQKAVELDYRAGSDGSPGSLLIDGRCYAVESANDEEGLLIRVNENDLKARITDERQETLNRLKRSSTRKGITTGKIKAPMPGLILKIEVELGMRVEKGSGVAIIEAMKMENEILASFGGVVTEIAIRRGEPVEKGQHLLTITQE